MVVRIAVSSPECAQSQSDGRRDAFHQFSFNSTKAEHASLSHASIFTFRTLQPADSLPTSTAHNGRPPLPPPRPRQRPPLPSQTHQLPRWRRPPLALLIAPNPHHRLHARKPRQYPRRADMLHQTCRNAQPHTLRKRSPRRQTRTIIT